MENYILFQLDGAKKEIEVHVQAIEDGEAARQKQKREIEDLRNELEKAQADFSRADKAKKKLQGELF